MMTVVVVLTAWVLLSLPAGMLIGSLCAHQRRHESRLAGVSTLAGVSEVAVPQQRAGLTAPAAVA